jgi:competence protein ComGC
MKNVHAEKKLINTVQVFMIIKLFIIFCIIIILLLILVAWCFKVTLK